MNNMLVGSAWKFYEFPWIMEDDSEGCILKLFNECIAPVKLANSEACNHLKSMVKPKKVIKFS